MKNIGSTKPILFSPGWGDAASKEKWAYTILWWLNDKYSFNEKILQQNLEDYFTGLTGRKFAAEKMDKSLFIPAKARVQKIKTLFGDRETYTATLSMFDAQVTKKPGILYIKVHVKNCPDQSKTFLLFEIAGSSFDQPVWQQLSKINEDFKCQK